MAADYERRTFTVSRCTWDPNAQQNITAIKSLAAQATPTVAESSHRIPSGAIAGIAIGGILGVAAMIVLGYFLYRRSAFHCVEPHRFERPELDSRKRLPPELVGNKHVGQEIDGKPHLGAEIDSRRLPGHEIDGNKGLGHELDSGQHGSSELPARETSFTELPQF